MEIIESAKPIYAILISFFATFLIAFAARSPNLRESWTVIAALIKFGIVMSMLPIILAGKTIEYNLLTVMPGLDIAFRVDAFSMFFAITASTLWIVTAFYCIGYMRSLKEKHQTRFYMCFALSLSAALGIAFSANLFTMFIFYEMLTLVTYPLVIHSQTAEAVKKARRYLVYLLGTSIVFQLTAMVATFYFAGTLEFIPGGILAGTASDMVIVVIFILFIAGIAKAGIMPFHVWLPEAMIAPTPVSALLHAVAVVKAGVFIVIKILLYVFGVDLLAELGLGLALAFVASFTIIAASVIALQKDNLKARLAYSTVGQLSYVVLAVSLLTPAAIAASLMHIMVHASSKITLFFTAGAIYAATKKKKISELDGIGKQMPLTMIAFTVGALSLIGVPLFAGFITKWYMATAAIEAGHLIFVGVIIISSMLNAAYFLPIVRAAFFKPLPEGEHPKVKELSGYTAFTVVPLLITAVMVVALFFAAPWVMVLAQLVVASVMGGS